MTKLIRQSIKNIEVLSIKLKSLVNYFSTKHYMNCINSSAIPCFSERDSAVVLLD